MSVAKLDQGEKQAVAGRRERFTWTMRLVDANGNRTGLGASDKVRFKLGTSADMLTPTIDIVSGTPSAAGSSVTIIGIGSSSQDATGVVELRRGDTSTLSGKYY